MSTYPMKDIDSMKSVDIRSVNKDTLIDLDSVQIDSSRPVQERVHSFLQQIQNPYCFRIGDLAVKVNYKKDGPSCQQNFEDILRTMHE